MDEYLTIVMISMHTSPLAQPGQGDAGGMNVYVRNLTEALIADGHQVINFTRKTSAADHPVLLDDATGSSVIPLSVGRLRLPKEALGELTVQFGQAVAQAVRSVARNRVVLHSHYWLSGVAALEAAAVLDSPVVHTMHTLGAAKNQSVPGAEPAYRVEREAFLSAKADMLVANTAAERRELVEHTGVVEQRVAVIPPGVDHEVFDPTGNTVWPGRQRPLTPKVLFAGRFQPFKGPHVLLEALAVLEHQRHLPPPLVHFTGANSGTASYDLRARAHLLGVAQHCSFSAPVSPTQLASHMRAADAVAMPSVSETFGLVAVEAQACGTPVIAHRAGGLSTAVKDGVTGRLLDSLDPNAWADALASLMQQPRVWHDYGAAAIEHAKDFSWAIMATRMVDVYRGVLKQP